MELAEAQRARVWLALKILLKTVLRRYPAEAPSAFHLCVRAKESRT